MHVIKKMKLVTARSSNCSVSAKFFPMLVEKPYLGGVINTKTYLNHELGSIFFSEWFGIWISEPFGFWRKKSYKMSKNWTLKKNYWSGTQSYLWIWSLFYGQINTTLNTSIDRLQPTSYQYIYQYRVSRGPQIFV